MTVEKVSTVTQSELIQTAVPTELLECKEIPIEPVGATKESEVSQYIIDLYDTADDCKRSLERVKQILKHKDN